ncbi:hypothetical protein TNCV_4830401 [Trichonephila clavipes]|nr:hypothetical protein TNCV_4830401 [Trichonephila clavipes]
MPVSNENIIANQDLLFMATVFPTANGNHQQDYKPYHNDRIYREHSRELCQVFVSKFPSHESNWTVVAPREN